MKKIYPSKFTDAQIAIADDLFVAWVGKKRYLETFIRDLERFNDAGENNCQTQKDQQVISIGSEALLVSIQSLNDTLTRLLRLLEATSVDMPSRKMK